MFSEGTWRQERDASWEQKENKVDSTKHMEQKITEWAKELQTVSEVRTVGLTPCDIYNIVQNLCTVYYVFTFFFTCVQRCGVMRQEFAHFLKQLELKNRKILTLLPFLEFITWSLLKQDSQVQVLDKRSINIKKSI